MSIFQSEWQVKYNNTRALCVFGARLSLRENSAVGRRKLHKLMKNSKWKICRRLDAARMPSSPVRALLPNAEAAIIFHFEFNYFKMHGFRGI